MGHLRDEIRSRLEGQEQRQAQRAAARAHRNRLNRVQEARREGKLDTLPEAEQCLSGIGITWKTTECYGMTLVDTSVGVFLPYRPDGVLDYRRLLRQPPSDQAPLFTDAPTA